MELDTQRDFFTESSPSALRAVFSSWSLEGCKQWCVSCPSPTQAQDRAVQYMTTGTFPEGHTRFLFGLYMVCV